MWGGGCARCDQTDLQEMGRVCAEEGRVRERGSMRAYTAPAFCGAVGWIVMLHALWCNPFAQLNEEKRETTCMITCEDVSRLTSVVQADDGRVYDASSLRVWMRTCQRTFRTPCVIHGQPIRAVWPVRVHRLVPRLTRRLTRRGIFIGTRAFRALIGCSLRFVGTSRRRVLERLVAALEPETAHRVGIPGSSSRCASVATQTEPDVPSAAPEAPLVRRAPRVVATRYPIPSEHSAFSRVQFAVGLRT